MTTAQSSPKPARRTFVRSWLLALAAAGCLLARPARAQILMPEPPEELQIDLVQKPGEQVPLDLQFTDSTGALVPLGKYFNQSKPVVLALVYYGCPQLCPLTLERLQDRLNDVTYDLGDDFYTLVVSFDHTNTTAQAASAKQAYLTGYKNTGDKAAAAGWEFFTSDAGSVRRLADSVGFPFKYIPESGQYSHGSALVVLTPEGRISRYLNGLQPTGEGGSELRLALLEASEGKIAKGFADFFLHRCFQWNPAKNAYTLEAFRVMQIGAILTAAAVATLLVALKAGERARAIRRATRADKAPQILSRIPAAMGPTP